MCYIVFALINYLLLGGKRVKRVFSKLLLVTMMVSIVLAGCSSNNSNSGNSQQNNGSASNSNAAKETVELKYWVPFSGSDGEYMEAMVKAFNESQNEVKVEFMNNNWDNYYPKLLSSLMTKSAPDVAVAHVSELPNLINTEQLELLDGLATEAGLDWSTYGANQVNSVSYESDHIAVPLDTHAVVMYYNKKYLGDAGLLNEDGTIKIEQSAEGFTNMLVQLKETLPADVSPLIIGSNNIFTYWIWYALVYQLGGQIFTDGVPTIDTPEGKQAMELIKSWIDQGLALPDIGDNSYDIFKSSGAAITFTGVWATGNFETEESLEFGAASFPTLFSQDAAWGDSHTLIVPKQDNKEKQIAAVKFADWLAENGHMWAKAGHVPVKPAVLESQQYLDLPYRSQYASVMDIVAYAPSSPQLGAVKDAILESLVEVNYGLKSVEEALSAAQSKADELVSR